ncbi:MAG TPA: PIN domain-containing protein [Actinomycetota bacterium]|nr:PIN domain-containing protein [Actinomycetota bacterium]
MITLDTSGIVALFSRGDRHHADAARALGMHRGPTVVPVGILAEVEYVLSSRLAPSAAVAFLQGLERGESLLDCGDADMPRVRELMSRYADLGLGFADAAVIACAERNGGDVLTFDRRDLEIVARDLPITLVPSVTT